MKPIFSVNNIVLRIVSYQVYNLRYILTINCSGPSSHVQSMSYYLYVIGSHHTSSLSCIISCEIIDINMPLQQKHHMFDAEQRCSLVM